MKVLVDKDFLEDGLEMICDSIRLKTGGTGVLAFPVEIKAAVDSIETGSGGITPTGTKTITENGEGIDVTSFAAVDVAVPIPEAPSGTKTITENGTGIDVAQYAAVDVAVPIGTADDMEIYMRSSGDVPQVTSSKIAIIQSTVVNNGESIGAILLTGSESGIGNYDIYSMLIVPDENGSWYAWWWGKNGASGDPHMSFSSCNVTITKTSYSNHYVARIEITLSQSLQYYGFSTSSNFYSAKLLKIREK